MERASIAPYSLSYRASKMADDCASGRSSLRVAIAIGLDIAANRALNFARMWRRLGELRT
jgi:hypothetical protein